MLFVIHGTSSPWAAAPRRSPFGFDRNTEQKHPNGGIQLNKFLFPECQRCLRIPLLNQMLVQLYLERQEVQELFVLHLQIPDNPGQEIISGEIVHFVWAVAEDIQELPSVQNR